METTRQKAERMVRARNQFEMYEALGLKLIGYWTPKKEEPQVGGYRWPGECVDPAWSAEERAKVVAYLKSNRKPFIAYAGYSWCRLCAEVRPSYKERNSNTLEDWECLGSAEYTDEVFVWPQGYVHYIEDHMVRPPQEFIDHVLGRNDAA